MVLSRLPLAGSTLIALILALSATALPGAGTFFPTSPHPKDFTIAASPSVLVLHPTERSFSILTLTSLGGFSGTITLTATVSPSSAAPPTVSLSPTSVTLKNAVNATSALLISTAINTTPGNYTVIVLAQSSKIAHTAAVALTVLTVTGGTPDFLFFLQPSSETITAGSSRTSFYNIISQNGFSGSISVLPTIPPGCSCGVGTTPVTVSPGGNVTGQIFINVGNSTSPGTYQIVFTASSGSLSQKATLALTVTSTQQPDFTITAKPRFLNVTRGTPTPGLVNITLTSTGLFSGTIFLTASIIPKIVGAPTALISPSNVTLAANGTGKSTLQINTNDTTTLMQYNYTVTGTSGTLSHTVVGEFKVIAPSLADFSILPTPEAFILTQGSQTRDFVNVTSLNGFSGTVNLNATVSPLGPRLVLGVNQVALTPGALIQVVLAIFTNTTIPTPVGNYTITVTGTSGSLVHKALISLEVSPVAERLQLQAALFQPTNVTLQIANVASISTSLVVYSVTDAAGDTWTRTGWPGPTIMSNSTATAHLTIGTSCPSCIYTGTPGAFTQFTPGHTYTIALVTARNNQFGFTATFPGSTVEGLSLDSYFFFTGTNVTLFLRNIGNSTVSLVAYYVRDSAGDQYALTTWTPEPTINPGTVGAPMILIGSSCPSCTLTGSPFTFTPGQSYTITIVTARNNPFTFTVTR